MPSQAQLDDTISACFSPLIASLDSGEDGKAPGILVGVTCQGSHSYYPFGTLPLEMPGAANPSPENIVLFIGSNTKVMTATLLALASYQKPPVPINGMTLITDLLPTAVPCHQWPGEPIRLWHLASHSAGYPDGPCGQTVWGDYSFAMTTRFLDRFKPGYEPGRYWVYSDQGFALLGVLLAHAYTGSATVPKDWDPSYQNWAAITADQVLWALSMHATQVGCALGQLPKLAQSFAFNGAGQSYTQEPVPQVNLGSAAIGAGALTSTLADMTTFLDSQISPPQSNLGNAIKLTQTAQGNGLSMGMGWQIGNGYFEKNGLVAGYASYMAFDPTAGYGLFALANSWGGDKGGLFCNTARKCLGELRGSATTPPKFPSPPCKVKPVCP